MTPRLPVDRELLAVALERADRGLVSTTWTDDALCAQTAPDVFFPQHGDPGAMALARSICDLCTADRVACVADGILVERASGHAGVRGGIAAHRIRKIARSGEHSNTARTRTRRVKPDQAAELEDAGHTTDQIADRLGVSERTVQRWSSRRRAA